jgi:hypothetical protein
LSGVSDKRNLVRELRKEAERLMGLEHWEAAEIVATEALTARHATRVRAHALGCIVTPAFCAQRRARRCAYARPAL